MDARCPESNNPRAMFAFKEIEEMLLKRMRSNYAPNKGNIFPWFAMSSDNHSPDNIAATQVAEKVFF